jgi:hypothetical protein
MDGEYIDLNSSVGEVVYALEPDYTWRRYDGDRLWLQSVRFEGTPEEVSTRLQELRDSVTWDEPHHMRIRSAAIGLGARPGTVRFALRAYLTNEPYYLHGPLLDVKRAMMRLILLTMLDVSREMSKVILQTIESYATAAVWAHEDECFLRQLRNLLDAIEAEKIGTAGCV